MSVLNEESAKAGTVELDTHADTFVGGRNCVMLPGTDTGDHATVHSFSEESCPFRDIPIGSVATAWVDPNTSETWVLVFHEALYFGDRLNHSLLCPNQLRAHGVTVKDTPMMFDKESPHEIRSDDGDLTIPLRLNGVMSLFDTHKPSEKELAECRRVELTSDLPWNPYDPRFAKQEDAAQYKSRHGVSAVHQNGDEGESRTLDEFFNEFLAAVEPQDVDDLNTMLETLSTEQVLELLDEDEVTQRYVSAVNISYEDCAVQLMDGRGDPEDLSSVPIGDVERKLSATVKERSPAITKELLAQRWGIGLNTAHRTLNTTTQRGVRTFLHPSDRRVPTRQPHLVFPTIRKKMYTDTSFAKVKSIRQNTCAQDWTDGKGYTLFYPMKSKSEAYTTIPKMVHDMNAIPHIIVSDGAKEESSQRWSKELRLLRAIQHFTEPYSQWQNRAEADIREIKKLIRKFTRRTGSPKRLWDYLGQYVAALRRKTAHDIPELDGRTPEENIHARVVDISAYCQFEWYENVWYVDRSDANVPATDERRKLGKWIGVAERHGSPMCYYILPKSCIPIPRTSVFPMSVDDKLSEQVRQRIKDLDTAIEAKIGDSVANDQVAEADFAGMPEIPDELFEEEDPVEPAEGEEFRPEADEYPTPEAFDQYLSMQVLLDRGGDTMMGTVRSRKRDADGNPLGVSNANPILDTREYEVEFPDGSVDVLTANLIAESMYAQVDEEGQTYAIISEILDHRKDSSATSPDDAKIPGTNRPRRTTRGWFLLVGWKDGTSDWVPLRELKESNPILVAEYAVNNKIVFEPAFAWWVPHVLRRRDRIIKKVQKRYWKRTHKFGIELPKTVEEALEIDRRTGTDFWQKAIEKELHNVAVAFEVQEDGTVPVGYKEIPCHFVFDIKGDTLARKARLVCGGHKTDPPKDMTYSSVVSRDTVRIFFLLAALNDLDIKACDVQNAYVQAKTKEKVWFRGKREFGLPEGSVVVIVRALYGLKSSGARFRDNMAMTLRLGGFEASKADPDLWMRPAMRADGTKFYEYVICYVDDIVYQGLKADEFMDYLNTVYTLKPGSVKQPETYLGADVRVHELSSGDKAWAISSDTYVKRAIAEVERELGSVSKELKKKVTSPMASGYRPELDASPELDERRASYYASLLGVLRWCIELGRIDIIVEVGLLSRFQASPREGHLEQLFHVFAYLKNYNRSSMVFDWTYPEIDESVFSECDWSEFYPGASEAIPSNMPEPRGKPVVMTAFVDADHAGCKLTRRSHSGVLIFVNRAPILWFSKRQATVEASTFGSESIAMRQGIEMIEGLRYKLRMMGVPIDGPTNIYCDNESVVKSSTRPESTLKKKHAAINYHRIREAQAATPAYIRIGWIPSEENLSDALTKVLSRSKRHYLFSRILW